MAENPTLAFLQQALSVSGANAPFEETALYNLFMQRLIVAGLTIDSSGNITAPFITANPNVSNATGTLAVGHGGTGIVSGTSGGILGFTGSTTVASSVLLTASALVLGGGAGATPTPMASLGTTTTLLHGNAAGAPTFGAVSLTADVIGTLPVATGGTGIATTTAYGVIVAGTTATGAFQNTGTGTSGQVLTSNGASAVPTFQTTVTPTYTAKTANYNAVANDVVAATSGTFTVTLPAASSNANKVIWVVNNGTGTITIGRTGADTIGLATSQTLNPASAGAQGDSMMFASDGVSNWNIF